MRTIGLAGVWSWLKRPLLFVGAVYVGLGLLLWLFQRRLIYLPAGGPVESPTGAPFEMLEDVRIETSDGVTLHAWYLPGSKAGSILVFHGNAGHRGHRIGLMLALHRLGYGVLIPDYRGYGGSAGSPSEAGFYLDAVASRDWLAARAPGPLVYLGNSIGTGVAVELALRHPPSALVLRSGFDSLGAVGQSVYPLFPVRLLIRDKYESIKKIGRIRAPLLAVHGMSDRIIPPARGKALYDAAAEPKRWLPLEGVGHNDLEMVAGARYFETLGRFLEAHVPDGR